MNNLPDFFDKITSGAAPAWGLGGAGIVLLLLALKVAKGFLKVILGVLALAALGLAVWWYFHNQGKI